jgi:hypothetical protein
MTIKINCQWQPCERFGFFFFDGTGILSQFFA